jgi:predicted nucleic acid-binding protein
MYIVTRDKDLLSLQHSKGITMITPEAFIPVVREQKVRRSAGDREAEEKA